MPPDEIKPETSRVGNERAPVEHASGERISGEHGKAERCIFIIAGEPSGDALGAELMDALRRHADGPVRFVGIGGEQMQAAGLKSLFPISELAVMGLLEVLPHARKILQRITQTVEAVFLSKPDVVITIDAPGFCFRVAKRLRAQLRETGSLPPLVHYVAPTVWAWKPKRAEKIAKIYDKLLVCLPFEPPYFEREGLSTSFVGHPVVTSSLRSGNGLDFRRKHGIGENAPVLSILPGSRRGEVSRLLPVFRDAVALLGERKPQLVVVTPTVSTVEHSVRAGMKDWPVPVHVVTGEDEKAGAFAASHVALAASGTVGLQLGAAGVPSVIAYRLNPLTYQIVKRMVRVDYVNLINILLGRLEVPELLQGECQPNLLTDAVGKLFDDPHAAARQRQAASEAVDMLRPPPAYKTPSDAAASAVLELI